MILRLKHKSNDHGHRNELFGADKRPSEVRSRGAAAIALSLMASRLVRLISLGLKSHPSVVRLCPLFFITGNVCGLKTLGFGALSFSLFTILRACDAVNMVFSLGELLYVADGLRLR